MEKPTQRTKQCVAKNSTPMGIAPPPTRKQLEWIGATAALVAAVASVVGVVATQTAWIGATAALVAALASTVGALSTLTALLRRKGQRPSLY